MGNIKYRKYQQDAVNQLEDQRKHVKDAGILVMATGTGKTVTSAFDTMHPGVDTVLFLAHQKEIIQQAKDEYETVYQQYYHDIDTGILGAGQRDYDADVLFATVQTLRKDEHLSKFDPDHFDYIVVDEFHHAQAPTYQKILDHFTPLFLLGLTATPFLVDVDKEDLLDLVELDEFTYTYPADEAIQNGDLAPFEAHLFKDNIDWDDMPDDMNESDLNRNLFLPKRNKHIVDKWEDTAGERKTIAFCRSIEHANRTAQHFQEQGVTAEPVHTDIPDNERDRRIQAFRDGDIQILTGVDMFNEGVDFPQVSCLIFMRPTLSRRIFHQQLGRGLRNAKNKDKCIVLDFVNKYNWNRFDWWDVNIETDYALGACEKCGQQSRYLLEKEGSMICKECRSDDVKIVTKGGNIHISTDVLFDMVEEYEKHRMGVRVSSKDLLQDIRQVAEKVGEPLTADDHRKHGKHSVSLICKRFGSLAAAYQKVGVDCTQRYDTEDKKLIQDVKRVAEKCGEPLLLSEYREHGNYGAATVQQNIGDGSWAVAVKKAGVKPYKDYKFTKQDVVEDIKAAGERVDGILSVSKYEDVAPHGYGRTSIDKFFDSWSEAKAAAGLDSWEHDVTKQELIQDMQSVTEEEDRLTQDVYNEHGKYTSSVVARRFETWNKAKEEAGLDTLTRMDGMKRAQEANKKYTKDIVVQKLRELNKRVDGKIRTKHLSHYDDMPSEPTVYKFFDTIAEAREAAGVT